jgi:hypothetical protein
MKLYEEFKLYENMWDEADQLAESSGPAEEIEIPACWERIKASAQRSPIFDPDNAPIVGEVPVVLSEKDLEKALQIGDSGLWDERGTSAPAEIIDQVNLLFWYDEYEESAHLSLELGGDAVQIAKYFDEEIKVGTLNISQKFQSYAQVETYFNTEIVPKAAQLASRIVRKSWKHYGFN